MVRPATQLPILSIPSDLSLGTERLHLRPPVAGDDERIAGLVTPDISRWMASWPAPCTVTFAADRIARARAAVAAGRALSLVVAESDGGEIVGMVEASMVADDPGRVTLGFWLGTDWQGRGYMTEAVRAVMRHLARDPAVRVIGAGAQLENAGSIAVMTKLGMRPAGIRMVYASVRNRDEACAFYEIDAATLV